MCVFVFFFFFFFLSSKRFKMFCFYLQSCIHQMIIISYLKSVPIFWYFCIKMFWDNPFHTHQTYLCVAFTCFLNWKFIFIGRTLKENVYKKHYTISKVWEVLWLIESSLEKMSWMFTMIIMKKINVSFIVHFLVNRFSLNTTLLIWIAC